MALLLASGGEGRGNGQSMHLRRSCSWRGGIGSKVGPGKAKANAAMWGTRTNLNQLFKRLLVNLHRRNRLLHIAQHEI